MTNEQRKAIELAKEFTKMDFNTPNGWTSYYDTELKELSEAIDTVLSLIKEQQQDMESLEKELNDEILGNYDREELLKAKLQKKDKQIDLMAEYISKQDVEEDICMKNKTSPEWCNEDYTNCKNCIKQYFERKVEDVK